MTKTVQQQMRERLVGWELFNLCKQDDRYTFDPAGIAGGIVGSEEERFLRWLHQTFGCEFRPIITATVLNAATENRVNPIRDCWGRMNNIFYVKFEFAESVAIGFFQRGPIYEIYEGFMERAEGVIDQHHLYI